MLVTHVKLLRLGGEFVHCLRTLCIHRPFVDHQIAEQNTTMRADDPMLDEPLFKLFDQEWE